MIYLILFSLNFYLNNFELRCMMLVLRTLIFLCKNYYLRGIFKKFLKNYIRHENTWIPRFKIRNSAQELEIIPPEIPLEFTKRLMKVHENP